MQRRQFLQGLALSTLVPGVAAAAPKPRLHPSKVRVKNYGRGTFSVLVESQDFSPRYEEIYTSAYQMPDGGRCRVAVRAVSTLDARMREALVFSLRPSYGMTPDLQAKVHVSYHKINGTLWSFSPDQDCRKFSIKDGVYTFDASTFFNPDGTPKVTSLLYIPLFLHPAREKKCLREIGLPELLAAKPEDLYGVSMDIGLVSKPEPLIYL